MKRVMEFIAARDGLWPAWVLLAAAPVVVLVACSLFVYLCYHCDYYDN